MRAKVVVFPIRGRNWCFSRSIDPLRDTGAQSSNIPSTLKGLYDRIVSSPPSAHEIAKNSAQGSKLEVTVDFIANKMNEGWTKLEKAPQGSLKNKIHGLGLKLLSRVKPSEIFFRSIPKDIAKIDVVYPSSLNPRLVRRRLRHIAFRGSVIHKKYLYGSAVLLPLTSVFMVLPLPNIAFFWVLFRTYSHWRASQGSEKLLSLVNEAYSRPNQSAEAAKREESSVDGSDQDNDNNSSSSPYALQPSEELQKLLQPLCSEDGLQEASISEICEKFHLNSADVIKYRASVF